MRGLHHRLVPLLALALLLPSVSAQGPPLAVDPFGSRAWASSMANAGPADLVRTVTAAAGFVSTAAGPEPGPQRDLADALEDLASRGGHPLSVGSLEQVRALPPTLAAPLRVLVSATVEAHRLRDHALAAPGATDLAAMAEGAALLAEAVEASLPALRAVATLPWASAHGHACGVLDAAPYLCVRGLGDDVWDASAWIAVDLGGNDVYANNQGGTALGIPVALLVDLGGDDRYTGAGAAWDAPCTADSALVERCLVAQGAGVNGIGVLWDAGGADTYEAVLALTPPPLTLSLPAPRVVAQGAGVNGAGLLVDLHGPDRFTAAATVRGGSAAVVAQGAANLGVGVLVGPAEAAEGEGTSYEARATSTPLLVSQFGTSTQQQSYRTGTATTFAQGAARVGAGALVDALGDDRYLAQSRGEGAWTVAQGATAFFGGFLAGGAGFLVDGAGTDRFEALAHNDGETRTELHVRCATDFVCGGSIVADLPARDAYVAAQGAGEAGVALLADLGSGAAEYRASAVLAPKASALVFFTSLGGTPGTLTAAASVSGGKALAHAQGHGGFGWGGLLGSAGASTYVLEARAQNQAVASTPTANRATATATGGNAEAQGQGFGATGAGVLADPAGDDRYRASAASAPSALQNGAPGAATPGTASWQGRGAAAEPGLGVVADAQGLDDHDATGGDDRCWLAVAPGSTALGAGADALSGGAAFACAPPL